MSTPPYYKKIQPSEHTRRIWEIFGHYYPRYCRARYDLTNLDSILIVPDADDENEQSPKPDPSKEKAVALFKKLAGMGDNELDATYANFTKARRAEAEAKHYLNRREAQADNALYEYYAKAAYWTLDEGVALILARDPKHLNCEQIKRFAQKPEIAENFLRLRELAQRASLMHHLAKHNTPGFFLAWARRCDLPTPDELAAAVEKFGGVIADWKSAYDQKEAETVELCEKVSALEARLSQPSKPPQEKSLSARERDSLLKMILGIAMEQYSHDPYASRTKTAKDIAEDMELHGLTMDQDTIRKYLAEARDRFLPGKAE